MKPALAAALLLSVSLLSGCWDKVELTNLGFIQAAAIDRAEGGRIRLTTQIYKPGMADSQNANSFKGEGYLNLEGVADTVSEAEEQIAARLGRRLQWSHMRTLLIGEPYAQTASFAEVLDFFSRSREPRGSINILITTGEAQPFLKIRPLIETTIGQQIRDVEEVSNRNLGAANKLSLLDLAILARTPSSIELVPRIRLVHADEEVAVVNGLAVLRFPEGKISDTVPVSLAPYLLMLRNQYKEAVVPIPCAEQAKGQKRNDTFRVTSVRSRMKVSSAEGLPLVRYRIDISGKIGELNCSRIETMEESQMFLKRFREEIEGRLEESLNFVRVRKADILHVRENVQRWHPRLWKKWSGDWENTFSRSRFETDVRITMTDTGMDAGDPFVSSEAGQ